MRFTNRKFAWEGLVNGKNLRDKKLYGVNSKIYINNSFCDEYRSLNYLIRKAKKDYAIFRWKIKNGINCVQLNDGDDFVEVTHKIDLVRLGIVSDIE